MKKFMTAVLLLCLCSVKTFAMTPEHLNRCSEIIEGYKTSTLTALLKDAGKIVFPIFAISLYSFSGQEKAAGGLALELGEAFGYEPLIEDKKDIGKALLNESVEWQRYIDQRIFKGKVETSVMFKNDLDKICQIAWGFANAFDTGNFTDFPSLRTNFAKSKMIGNTTYVATAHELKKALDNKKVEHIVITDNITGNFKIYRWLRSIRGQQKVQLRPQDTQKPVFETELEIWFRETPSIEMSNLHIFCHGGGIDSSFNGRKWLLLNCHFTGDNEKESWAFSDADDVVEADNCLFGNLRIGMKDCKGTLRNCTFENVSQCAVSKYGQQIETCHFDGCNTILVLQDDEGPASSIVRSTVGKDGPLAWCVESRPDDDSDSQPVTIDAATLQSCRALTFRAGSTEAVQTSLGKNRKAFYTLYADCIKNARQQDQFTERNKECEDSFKQSIRNKDLAWALQHARSEWDKYQHVPDKENLEHLLVLYRQFVQLPILQISDRQALEKFTDAILKKTVSDTYLCQNMADLFIWSDMQEPATPFAASPYIKLANISSTLDLLAEIAADSPQKTLRSSLDFYIEWIQLVKKYKTTMEQIKEQARHMNGVDTDYAAAVQRSVMKSNEIFENVSRVTRALYFDLPTQAFFCSRYAQTWKAGKNKNAIERIVRSSVPFYKIYSKLCVLPSTNTLYQKYLMQKWKKVLKEDKFESLKALTATDPDMMSDNSRVEAFFRDYQ